MAQKDWNKVDDMRYVSKNTCGTENTHYGYVSGYSELMCSKLDNTYFVSKMIGGIRVSLEKFPRKTEARKCIISHVKNGAN